MVEVEPEVPEKPQKLELHDQGWFHAESNRCSDHSKLTIFIYFHHSSSIRSPFSALKELLEAASVWHFGLLEVTSRRSWRRCTS